MPLPISIKITVKNAASRALKLVGKGLRALALPLRMAKRGFRALKRGLKASLKPLAALGLAAGAAAFGVLKLVGSHAKEADHLAKVSRNVGLTVEQYQELAFAADRAGVSSEEFEGSIRKLGRNIGELRAGTGTLTTFLAHLGAKGFKKQLAGAKDSNEAFELMIQALANTKDPAKRAALAAAAFGRSGMKVATMAEGGVTSLRKLREEKRKYGLISTKAANQAEKLVDAQTNLSAVWGGLKADLLSGVVPALTKGLSAFAGWTKANKGLIKQRLSRVFKAIGNAIKRVDWDRVRKTVVRFAKKFREVAERWIPPTVEFIKVAWEGLKKAAGVIVDLLVALWEPVKGAFSGFVTFLTGVFEGDVNMVWAGIKSVWRNAVEFFELLWDGVKDLFVVFYEWLSEVIDKFAPEPIKRLWRGIDKFFKGVFDGVTSVIQTAWEVIGGIIDKIKGGFNWIVDKAAAVGEAVNTINPFAEDVALGSVTAAFDAARMQTPKATANAPQEQLAQHSGATSAWPRWAGALIHARTGRAAAPGAVSTTTKSETEVKITLANAPPGTHVQTRQKQGTARVAVKANTGKRRVGGS